MAFLVTTQREVDADTTNELSEVVGDFQFYLPKIREALVAHNITLLVLHDSTVIVRGPNGGLRVFSLAGPNRVSVGYWFFKPGAPPASLLGSVLTHLDVLSKASGYFGLPITAAQ